MTAFIMRLPKQQEMYCCNRCLIILIRFDVEWCGSRWYERISDHHVITRAGRVPVSYAFPTFIESMSALFRKAFDGSLFAAYAETLKPLVIGIAISAVLGISIGLWVGLGGKRE